MVDLLDIMGLRYDAVTRPILGPFSENDNAEQSYRTDGLGGTIGRFNLS